MFWVEIFVRMSREACLPSRSSCLRIEGSGADTPCSAHIFRIIDSTEGGRGIIAVEVEGPDIVGFGLFGAKSWRILWGGVGWFNHLYEPTNHMQQAVNCTHNSSLQCPLSLTFVHQNPAKTLMLRLVIGNIVKKFDSH